VDGNVNNAIKFDVQEYIDDYFPWMDDYMPKYYNIRHIMYFPEAPLNRPYGYTDKVTLETLIYPLHLLDGSWIGFCYYENC